MKELVVGKHGYCGDYLFIRSLCKTKTECARCHKEYAPFEAAPFLVNAYDYSSSLRYGLYQTVKSDSGLCPECFAFVKCYEYRLPNVNAQFRLSDHQHGTDRYGRDVVYEIMTEVEK